MKLRFFHLPFYFLFALSCGSGDQDQTIDEGEEAHTKEEILAEPTSYEAEVTEPAPTEDTEREEPPIDLVRDVEAEQVEEKGKEAPKETEPPKPKPKTKKVAKILFAETTFSFDSLAQGDKVTHKFEFENTGMAPLEIKNVEISCGCTYPSYPFIPLQPGETGFIGITYNSVGKEGFQKAPVTVITNDPQNKKVTLTLEGSVYVKE